MEINIFQVDAFSDRPFGGNPAGVVPNARFLSEEQMQNIAKEMNLSETAFVTPVYDDVFIVRYFTPLSEVDLCGHATIATFFTMAKKGYIQGIWNGKKTIYQKTKAGRLAVELTYVRGKIDRVFMEQAGPKELGPISDLDELLKSINIGMEDIGFEDKGIYPEIISTGLSDIILPIRTKEKLDNLKVDMELLSKVSKDYNVVGLHAFYLPRLNSEMVYTRNFAPLVGINEESATGTSNGSLIYYLTKNRLIENNNILSYQGDSMGRPSKIYCTIDDKDKIWVGGQAKIMIDGIISI